MFIGEYRHTVDEKKRLSLPAKFRTELGKKIVATRGLDNCLYLYPHKTWLSLSKETAGQGHLKRDQREMRFIYSGAAELEVDAIGRVLIPEFLKEFAALKQSVVLTGVHDRVEVWDEKRWSGYKKKLEQEYAHTSSFTRSS